MMHSERTIFGVKFVLFPLSDSVIFLVKSEF
jgi:hypothetical protein